MSLRLVAITAWLSACASPPPTEKRAASVDRIRIGGSETLTNSLIPDLANVYKKSHKDLDFEVTGGGTGAGIRQLIHGTLDIAAASRMHHAAEEEQAKAAGFSLRARGAQQIIGVDVVAVVVPDASPIEVLTYDQVIGIFCTRTIDNLNFIHPSFGDHKIRPVTRSIESGTRALFEDFFCGPSGIHPRIEVQSSAEIQQLLRSDPSVISFSTMTTTGGKVVPLRADAQSSPVIPSQKNIANGSYPLYRDIYLYTPGPPSGSTKTFIDWVLSPAGQDVVDENFFVPIYHRSASLDGPRPLRETINFEPGESYPNQRSIARIQLLVQELSQRGSKGQHIILEGYTDSTEKDQTKLSEARAKIVKELLEKQLPDLFFEIIPRGDAHPIAPNNTPYGRYRNRRVQIYLASEESHYDEAVVDPHAAPSE